jgi:NADH-quinone oxidoreductase subunit M
LKIHWTLGIDGISLLLVLLTTLIMPLCVLCSWQYIQSRVKEFMICLLIMESAMIGVFCALDFILFFVFWEAMLIPMALLIGIWGGPRKVYAAVKFFIYTMAGSVLLLVAIIALFLQTGTFHIPDLMGRGYSLPLPMLGVSWLSRFPSRSKCRCSHSTPGCRLRMSKRPRPAVCCSPVFC